MGAPWRQGILQNSSELNVFIVTFPCCETRVSRVLSKSIDFRSQPPHRLARRLSMAIEIMAQRCKHRKRRAYSVLIYVAPVCTRCGAWYYSRLAFVSINASAPPRWLATGMWKCAGEMIKVDGIRFVPVTQVEMVFIENSIFSFFLLSFISVFFYSRLLWLKVTMYLLLFRGLKYDNVLSFTSRLPKALNSVLKIWIEMTTGIVPDRLLFFSPVSFV